MTLALYGKSRKRQGLLGLLAVLAVVLAIAAAGATQDERSAQAATPLPSNVTLTQWADDNNPNPSWITGALIDNNSNYAEGETVPFRLAIPANVAAGEYEFAVCRDFLNSSRYGYLVLEPFNTSRSPAIGTISDTDGAFAGENATITSVTETNGQGGCNADERQTIVVIQTKTVSNAVSYIYWGGHLAAPGDAVPGGGTVPAGGSAGEYPGGSLHMSLASPSKDVAIQTSAIEQAEEGIPFLSKTNVGYDTTTDTATWTVTIDNTDATTGGTTVARNVTVTDTGATLTAVNVVSGTGSCGTLPDNDGSFDCSVGANSKIELTVTKAQAQQCTEGSISNTASAVITGTSDALAGSPATASPDITVPADQSLCDLPTIAKAEVGYNSGTDTATWTVTVDNTGTNTIARNVVVTDSGATLTTAVPDTCGTLPDSDGTFNCSVAANSTLVLTVTKVQGQQCQASSIDNQATLSVGGSPVGTTQIVTIQIPSDESLCGLPTLSKTASGFAGGFAQWTITLTGGDATTVVTVNDPDVVLAEAACGLPAGTAVNNIDCSVGTGGLSFLVQRAVQQACEPTTAENSASAFVNDSHIGGSPTGVAEVAVPGDEALCPVLTSGTITVQKFFDNDDSGTINAPDSLINGWGMTLSCDNGDAAVGETGTDGNGTVVFNVTPTEGDVNCSVTEGVQVLVAVVGHAINGGALQAGAVANVTLSGEDSALVQFLNDPTDLPPPPPPGTEGPIPQANPQIPQPQEPEEPTPAPTEPVQPTQEPQEPEPTETPAGQATPVAPAAGSGTTLGGTRSAGSLWLAAAGLLALTGATGALALARRKA